MSESDREKYAEILIVDDQVFNVTALDLLLNTFGIKSDSAFSGQEAIKLIRKRFNAIDTCPIISNYKLIFMDFSMPDMNGIETTKAIY